MLWSTLEVFSNMGTIDFQIIGAEARSASYEGGVSQSLIWLGFFLAFAIKTPIIPFHLWLSEAHTEAPTGASILLAGILLKLATYGLLRVCLGFLADASLHYAPLVYTLATISIIYSSFTILRQIDLKRIIAYSSIGHMGISIIAIFSNTIQGIEGGILLSLAHGIVSPALFICAAILYDRYHSRLIKYYRGLVITMPIFSSIFFFMTLANMAVPLTGNFIGEFLSFMGTFQKNPIIAAIAASSMVLVAAYSIWLYNRICFGNESMYLIKAKDLTRREFFLLVPLIFLTLLLGIYPNVILDSIHLSVSSLLGG
jgi:NADH-ubiquinone oxidoreductase chain 4